MAEVGAFPRRFGRQWLFWLLAGLLLISPLLHSQALLPAPEAAPAATPPAEAAAAPRIGLLSMSPGREYWARFGHNALVVALPGRTPISYNYGYFDFDQPGFLLRFLRGEMRYRLLALPLETDLAQYAEEGRGVTLQWLALTPAQAQQVAAYLAWNARPENAEYRYDYFTANCSTRVRDVLDQALEGALSRQLGQIQTGLSYRSEALRLGAGIVPLLLGMHAGLGPYADRSLSLWDAAFLPRHLAEALAQARDGAGRPLVEAQERLLPDRLGLEAETAPALRRILALIGLGLAGLLLVLLRQRAGRLARRLGASLAGLLWLVCGLGGLLLAALWGLSAHQAAWANQNLLLFNPLCLLLLAALPALARGHEATRGLRLLAAVTALLALLALVLGLMPAALQDNADFIVLLLPMHAALALRLARPGRRRAASLDWRGLR